MKTLIDTRYIRKNPCGIGNYTLNLTKALSNLNEPDLDLFALSHKDNQTDMLKDTGVKALETEINFTKHPQNEIYLNTSIPKMLRQQNFDIFHGPAVFIPFRKHKDYKLVTSVHDIVSIRFPETVPLKYRLYLKHMTKSAIKNADAIICASHNTKKDIMENFKADEKKMKVVHYASDEFYFQTPSTDETSNLLEKLNLKNTPYILSVGNIEPRKNLLNLIKAFKIVKESNKDLKLILTGRKGWLYKDILAEAETIKDDIIFTGYVTKPELRALYANSLFFVFATLYEGFGIPLLEAMATKTAVIASDTSSLPEIAKDNALYIDPYNHKDIAEKIIYLAKESQLREKLAESGFLNAKDFSWEKCAKQTFEVYNNIK